MLTNSAAQAAWDALRATRANPPGFAGRTSQRRRTYSSSLEQAEQFFRAAASVGPATQPVLVFYGLSQAGRAIAAAATGLKGDDWRLGGHGIHTKNMDLPLPQVQATTDPSGHKGSFARLSDLLESPLWGNKPVALTELWDCLPSNMRSPLHANDEARRTPLYADVKSMEREKYENESPRTMVGVPVVNFPPWVVSASDRMLAFTTYLASFPEAQGFYNYAAQGAPQDLSPTFSVHTDGWGELIFNWPMPDGQPARFPERLGHLKTLTRPYDGDWYFVPAVGGSVRGLHPLMAWWAVVHGLSNLCRYQPSDWAQHINVDGSPHAVPIEKLLTEAIRVLPRLVEETIATVAV